MPPRRRSPSLSRSPSPVKVKQQKRRASTSCSPDRSHERTPNVNHTSSPRKKAKKTSRGKNRSRSPMERTAPPRERLSKSPARRSSRSSSPTSPPPPKKRLSKSPTRRSSPESRSSSPSKKKMTKKQSNGEKKKKPKDLVGEKPSHRSASMSPIRTSPTRTKHIVPASNKKIEKKENSEKKDARKSRRSDESISPIRLQGQDTKIERQDLSDSSGSSNRGSSQSPDRAMKVGRRVSTSPDHRKRSRSHNRRSSPSLRSKSRAENRRTSPPSSPHMPSRSSRRSSRHSSRHSSRSSSPDHRYHKGALRQRSNSSNRNTNEKSRSRSPSLLVSGTSKSGTIDDNNKRIESSQQVDPRKESHPGVPTPATVSTMSTMPTVSTVPTVPTVSTMPTMPTVDIKTKSEMLSAINHCIYDTRIHNALVNLRQLHMKCPDRLTDANDIREGVFVIPTSVELEYKKEHSEIWNTYMTLGLLKSNSNWCQLSKELHGFDGKLIVVHPMDGGVLLSGGVASAVTAPGKSVDREAENSHGHFPPARVAEVKLIDHLHWYIWTANKDFWIALLQEYARKSSSDPAPEELSIPQKKAYQDRIGRWVSTSRMLLEMLSEGKVVSFNNLCKISAPVSLDPVFRDLVHSTLGITILMTSKPKTLLDKYRARIEECKITIRRGVSVPRLYSTEIADLTGAEFKSSTPDSKRCSVVPSDVVSTSDFGLESNGDCQAKLDKIHFDRRCNRLDEIFKEYASKPSIRFFPLDKRSLRTDALFDPTVIALFVAGWARTYGVVIPNLLAIAYGGSTK